jgi:5-methylcytosine-specific restriction endonuclease McrA
MTPRHKPLKRSWISRKPRKARVSWRSGKIRLDRAGMAGLRWKVFERAGYRCENKLRGGRRCLNKFVWQTFQLHHIISRGQGGSDTEENTMALCVWCHADTHHGVWKASRHDAPTSEN